MRRWLIFLFWLYGAQVAGAEQITLRTADHSSFTRLAFDTKSPDSIAVSHDGKTIAIRVPRATTVELGNPFRRIKKDRIADISYQMGEQVVQVMLTCNCKSRTEIIAGRMFILDVLDASDESSEQPVAVDWAPVARAKAIPLSFGHRMSHDGLKSVTNSKPDVAPDNGLHTLLPSSAMNASDARLLEKLEETVSAVSEPDHKSKVPPTASEPEKQMDYRSLHSFPEPGLTKVETAAARLEDVCKPLALVDPSGWLTTQVALDQYGSLRAQLFRDQNSADAVGAIDLAKAYLSMAMGAEAIAVLEMLPEQPESITLLSAFAARVDGMPVKDPTIIQKLAHCTAQPAVMVILRSGEISNVDAARADFDAWPDALKGALAARFANALLDHGQADAALSVLRRSDKTPEATSGERGLATARIAQDQGDKELAQRHLEQVAASDGDVAPEAVIALAELKLDAGGEGVAQHNPALEVYAHELSQTDRAPHLLRARLRGLINERDFETAINLFQDYALIARATQQDMILDELGAGILAISSDAQFMRETIALPANLFRRLGIDTKADITARMVKLGFEDLASTLGSRHAQPVGKASESAPSGGLNKNEVAPENQQTAESVTDATAAKPADRGTPVAEPQQPNELSQAIGQSFGVLEGASALKEQLEKLGF